MLILIICLILTLVGISLLIINARCVTPDWFDEDIATVTGGFLSIMCGAAVIVMSIVMIVTAATTTYHAEVLTAERQSLELRLEKSIESPEDGIVEMNGLYRDIYEYNMKVKSYKYWGDNPWTNWFYGRKEVKESKYVELKETS